MTLQPPCDVSVFWSAGVSVSCCILFYMFEVPSQSKKSSCTRLVHKCPKINNNHTANLQALLCLCTEAALTPCDIIRARLRRWHNDHTISERSHYNFTTVCHRNPSKNIECKRICRSQQLPTMPEKRNF